MKTKTKKKRKSLHPRALFCTKGGRTRLTWEIALIQPPVNEFRDNRHKVKHGPQCGGVVIVAAATTTNIGVHLGRKF